MSQFSVPHVESVKDVKPSLDSVDSLIRFLVRQIFIERCMSQLSQFLRYTQVQTNADTQTLTIKAVHEEEKLSNIRKNISHQSSTKTFSKPCTSNSVWCSHCKAGTHNTSNCRSRTIKTCNYCHLKGRIECEC